MGPADRDDARPGAPSTGEVRLRSVLHWDDRGIVLGARQRSVRRGDPWAWPRLGTRRIPWERVAWVRADVLFPEIRIGETARGMGFVSATRAGLLPALHEPAWAGAMPTARDVEAHGLDFIAYVHARRPAVLERGGWAAASRVAWESTRAPRSSSGRGPAPFREATPPTERVEFRDEDRAAGPRGAWPHRTGERVVHPDVIEVTEEHVIARTSEARFRMTRGALRAIVREHDRTGIAFLAHFLFGRDAHLVVSLARARRLEEWLVPAGSAIERDEFHPHRILFAR